ncbi:MAG: histidine--tRNA ligase [Sediminibacterium sp.]|nr:histidine--tRNA ligase [Sediminibacterium sp.]
MRDFNATILQKRNFIIQTIKQVFELYGFEPLETPTMENSSTLMEKYGEEGDKLIFRVLDSGNPFSKIQGVELSENNFLQIKNQISEKSLRYDLTIPFARYVAMNHAVLPLPFKRYQIQPVWRGDRPQKGRYREFYQCDVDVVGSNSLLNEVDLLRIYNTVFKKLNLPVKININNRKILSILTQFCNTYLDTTSQITTTQFCTIIDKIDKIGWEKIAEQLQELGIPTDVLQNINHVLNIKEKNNIESLQTFNNMFDDSFEDKNIAIQELETILSFCSDLDNIKIDFSLARGLNYYTGMIVEVAVDSKDIKMGSIGGGGRYDNLTAMFGVPNLSGVGVSFGLDRIYDVMEELKLFPQNIYTNATVLFFNLGNEEAKKSYTILQILREKNIRAEIYPDTVKLVKQFKYAEAKNIPNVIIIGSKELEKNQLICRNIITGIETIIAMDNIENLISLLI